MNTITATAVLIDGLTRLAEFGTAIATARAENRDLTPEEVNLARDQAQGALDRLEQKVAAAGG